jgi:hypothetical protein
MAPSPLGFPGPGSSPGCPGFDPVPRRSRPIGAPSYFDTMPSRPVLQARRKFRAPSSLPCALRTMPT